MRASRWVCVLGLVGGIAACGPGATGTSDAGGDVARTEAGMDVGPSLDGEAGAPGEGGTEAATQCPDMDDDGHGAAPCGDDCDDTDRRRYPGAREICDGEGRDEDCNPCTVGEVLPSGMGGDSDRDEDGYPSTGCFNRITGEAMPVCGAGTRPDGGAESFARVSVDPAMRETRGTDCDDTAVTRNPAAPEDCDAAMQDENCNMSRNEGCECATGTSQVCQDSSGRPLPGVCGSGRQDCIDGRLSMCSIAPAAETCNERDDDCDGETDEGLLRTFYADEDGDGFGSSADAARTVMACAPPPGFSADHTDCDDAPGVGATVNLTAREVCDELMRDENCDGSRNERCDCVTGASRACADEMNVALPGVCGTGTQDCIDGHWGRCSISPTAEVCNSRDDDCNGMTDEGVQRTFYVDSDGDGFGASASGAATMMACVAPTGFVENRTDCDDSAATGRSINPSATEICDVARRDENCNGMQNEGCTCTNGMSRACPALGACARGTQNCVGGTWSACSILSSPETCDGVDNNCDGSTDEGLTIACYLDGDSDGYAPAGAVAMDRCPASAGVCPGGYTSRPPTATSIDCDPVVTATNPGATEVSCNGKNDDCNDATPDTVSGACYTGPAGTQGIGLCRAGSLSCVGGAPSCGGQVTPAIETCDGRDNDCDRSTDEGYACVQSSTVLAVATFYGIANFCTKTCTGTCTIPPACFDSQSRSQQVTGASAPHPSGGSANGSGWQICGIVGANTVMILTPGRTYSVGSYTMSYDASLDSSQMSFEWVDQTTGAIVAQRSESQATTGGSNRAGSFTVSVSDASHSYQMRVRLSAGSNAFACNLVRSVAIAHDVTSAYQVP